MSSSIAESIMGTDNGIVSKKILNGNGGSVSLFAFDEGQTLDKHSTPNKAAILAIEGKARFEKGKEKIILNKDDYLILAENEEHALEAMTPFKMLLVIIKP